MCWTMMLHKESQLGNFKHTGRWEVEKNMYHDIRMVKSYAMLSKSLEERTSCPASLMGLYGAATISSSLLSSSFDGSPTQVGVDVVRADVMGEGSYNNVCK